MRDAPLELRRCLGGEFNTIGAIDFPCQRLKLLLERHLIWVEKVKLWRLRTSVDNVHDGPGEVRRARAAVCPMSRLDRVNPRSGAA